MKTLKFQQEVNSYFTSDKTLQWVINTIKENMNENLIGSGSFSTTYLLLEFA